MSNEIDWYASRPLTAGEWLLQEGEAPDMSPQQHLDAVVDAIEQLSEQSRFCIEAIFYEQISYSELATRLGVSKPHAWRLTQVATEQLKHLLSSDRHINERYTLYTTWNDASWAMVRSLDNFAPKTKITSNDMDHFVSELHEYVLSLVYGSMFETILVSTIKDMGRAAISHLKHIGEWDMEAMEQLLVKKQHDYGHANIEGFGYIGLAVRLCDKVARIKTLETRGAKPKNESVIDSWVDIVGYAVISQMISNDTFKLDLVEAA